MTARLLDGRDVASHLRRELQHRVERLTDGDPDAAPQLAILRSGSSHAAGLYAASLERAARSVGVEPLSLTEEMGPLLETIERLNRDPRVAGIVVAQPLVDAEHGRRLVERIDPAKDVDGATPTNAGWLARGEPAFVPATALAVIAILEAYDMPVAGRRPSSSADRRSSGDRSHPSSWPATPRWSSATARRTTSPGRRGAPRSWLRRPASRDWCSPRW